MFTARQRLHALGCASVLALLFAAPAHATAFNFSYTFEDGTRATGTLSGELAGSVVRNLSDVHVSLNGTPFAGGALYMAGWNAATVGFDDTVAPVVSTDAALNNFIFADSRVPADFGATNYFYIVNDPASIGNTAFATDLNTGDIALDGTVNRSWSLIASAVPEPQTALLMLAGLGLLAVSRRPR